MSFSRAILIFMFFGYFTFLPCYCAPLEDNSTAKNNSDTEISTPIEFNIIPKPGANGELLVPVKVLYDEKNDQENIRTTAAKIETSYINSSEFRKKTGIALENIDIDIATDKNNINEITSIEPEDEEKSTKTQTGYIDTNLFRRKVDNNLENSSGNIDNIITTTNIPEIENETEILISTRFPPRLVEVTTDTKPTVDDESIVKTTENIPMESIKNSEDSLVITQSNEEQINTENMLPENVIISTQPILLTTLNLETTEKTLNMENNIKSTTENTLEINQDSRNTLIENSNINITIHLVPEHTRDHNKIETKEMVRNVNTENSLNFNLNIVTPNIIDNFSVTSTENPTAINSITATTVLNKEQIFTESVDTASVKNMEDITIVNTPFTPIDQTQLPNTEKTTGKEYIVSTILPSLDTDSTVLSNTEDMKNILTIENTSTTNQGMSPTEQIHVERITDSSTRTENILPKDQTTSSSSSTDSNDMEGNTKLNLNEEDVKTTDKGTSTIYSTISGYIEGTTNVKLTDGDISTNTQLLSTTESLNSITTEKVTYLSPVVPDTTTSINKIQLITENPVSIDVINSITKENELYSNTIPENNDNQQQHYSQKTHFINKPAALNVIPLNPVKQSTAIINTSKTSSVSTFVGGGGGTGSKSNITNENILENKKDHILDIPNIIFYPELSILNKSDDSNQNNTKKFMTPVKFLAPIRRTLDFGHSVIVKGITGGENSYGPSINLMNGDCHWNQRHDCDLILNIYVNLSNPIDQVQRSFYNAGQRKYHEIETYGGAPFEPYTDFEIEIIPRTDLFEIKVNKKYFCSFTYKMPLALVNHVLISTGGEIYFVRIEYLKKSLDGIERPVGGEVLINSLEEN